MYIFIYTTINKILKERMVWYNITTIPALVAALSKKNMVVIIQRLIQWGRPLFMSTDTIGTW